MQALCSAISYVFYLYESKFKLVNRVNDEHDKQKKYGTIYGKSMVKVNIEF